MRNHRDEIVEDLVYLRCGEFRQTQIDKGKRDRGVQLATVGSRVVAESLQMHDQHFRQFHNSTRLDAIAQPSHIDYGIQKVNVHSHRAFITRVHIVSSQIVRTEECP
jgi:hypothetical protein